MNEEGNRGPHGDLSPSGDGDEKKRRGQRIFLPAAMGMGGRSPTGISVLPSLAGTQPLRPLLLAAMHLWISEQDLLRIPLFGML
jgi:hypothetical protein